MKIKKLFLFLFLIGVFLQSGLALAADKIRIVTTTSTLASIAQAIAGDKADIYSIASPNRDIHFISPTPKDVIKVKKADVFIHGGLDLEAWRNPLLDAVGRTDLMPPNGPRAIDVSKGIPLLEVPTSLSRMQGDQHAFGNPHYWTDPRNAKTIARDIEEGLAGIDPEDADFFRKNAEAFQHKIDEKMKDWENQMAPYKGSPVVIYHNTWPYFMETFGLVIAGTLEPKPGIPPTPKHLQEVTKMMKEKNIKVIVKEVFHESRAPKKLAKETGAAIVILKTEAGQAQGDYFSFIDQNIQDLVKALK